MTWTATTFKAAKPEFGQVLDAVVTTALSDAASECDARVYGATYDQAVGLLAAHKLVVTPFGQASRPDAKQSDGASPYLAEFQRLGRKKGGGPWTMGQGPTGMLP